MQSPVMRGSLRFLPEGFGKFEMVGHARDGEEAVVVWAVGSGLLRRFAAAAHCGEAVRIKLGDDTDHPAYTFIAPSVGYRMPKGEKQRE